MNKNIIAFFMKFVMSIFFQISEASEAVNLNPIEQRFIYSLTKLGLDIVAATTMSNDDIMALKCPLCSSSDDQQITPEYWKALQRTLL